MKTDFLPNRPSRDHTSRAVFVLVTALAFLVRVVWLDLKPPHFDEGVNGMFVDHMTRSGFYSYDPTNFHGPLHFYLLFVAQTLFGRSLWVLRMPTVLAGTACVAMMFAFRGSVGTRACQIAALAMALSPAFSFYSRYAIHETEFVLFLMMLSWGLIGLCHEGSRKHLWVTAAGITGAILTKETYVIHFVVMMIAAGCVALWDRVNPSGSSLVATQHWSQSDLRAAILVPVAVLVFFYTGGFLDWRALAGPFLTFATWFQTGTKGASGHEKDCWYWFELLARYEWPALMGLSAAPAFLGRGTNPAVRWFAFTGAGTLAAYALIAYKTPWCLISFAWIFLLLFGVAIARLWRGERWLAAGLAVVTLWASGTITRDLNFRSFTNEDEPYVYVQTLPDIEKLLWPLRTLVSRDPTNAHLFGHIVLAEIHPLPWLLGDFTHVDFPPFDELPEHLDADVLLVDEPLEDQIAAKLRGTYFRDSIRLRGQADNIATLFLSVAKFRELYPDRTPEFMPEP